MKIIANLIKIGNVLEHKGKKFHVLNTNTIKPGKGGAYIQVEMRDVKSGAKVNERFRTSENVEKLSVNEILVTFLFIDDNFITFMNNENFEQSSLDKNLLSGNEDFLSEGMQLTVEIIGEEIVNIKLPKSITVEVKTADAVVKGQTAASSNKPAILENGIRVMVPPFIEQGEKIEINTEDLTYSKRAD